MGFASNKVVADEPFLVPRRIALGNFKLCGVMLNYAGDEMIQVMKSAMGWLAMSRTRPSARPMDIGSGERLGTETGYKAGERNPVVWRPTCSGSQAPATHATCGIADD